MLKSNFHTVNSKYLYNWLAQNCYLLHFTILMTFNLSCLWSHFSYDIILQIFVTLKLYWDGATVGIFSHSKLREIFPKFRSGIKSELIVGISIYLRQCHWRSLTMRAPPALANTVTRSTNLRPIIQQMQNLLRKELNVLNASFSE